MKAPSNPIELIELIPSLLSEGILNPTDSASVRIGNFIFITPKDIPIQNLPKSKKKKWVEIPLHTSNLPFDAPPITKLHLKLYRSRHDFNAIIRTTSENILTCSMAGETVLPYLDDMAQIIGSSVKVVPYGENDSVYDLAVKGIRRKNAVLIKDHGAICGHRTLDDLYAVCHVFEKACKAFIEARILGGGKPVPWIEAELIRFVYQRKYSKQAEKNK